MRVGTITGAVLTAAIMVLVMSALGALVATQTVSNTGNIGVSKTSSSSQLGLYSDCACTTPLNSIQWGTMNPGETATATICVRNEGSSAVTLSLQTDNWNPPSAESYFTLEWDLEGGVLQPGVVIQGLLTLNVSSSISGITNFSFDITITATQ